MNRYVLAIKKPETHLVEISVQTERARNDYIDFVLPAWSPGSYKIRDYSKNVVEAEARDTSGKKLACEKIKKNVWRVSNSKSNPVIFSCQIYCHEFGTHSSFVDDSHASLHGPGLFVYPEGMQKEKCSLSLAFPSNWKKISTGLEPAQGDARSFEAPDYDTLIDSPIEIGNHSVYTFKVQNIPHRVALYGHGNVEPERLVSDTKKIVEAAVSVFRHIPYPHYTFIIQLLPERGGGLEHLNSTLIQVNRWGFKPESEYRKILSLVSHEFFHLWNVKRLTPRPLVSFDYTKENYTELLWVAEGITSYYEDLILLRAGLYNLEQYFEALCDDYKAYLDTPGRNVQSLCESSFDTWIKFYQLGESSKNLTISYYRKGALIGMGLDLLIRKATRNGACLDDVMRNLYEETYRRVRKGYTLREFRGMCNRVAGVSLDDFFERHVLGRENFSPDEFLKPFGLELSLKKEKENAKGGHLGIELKKGDPRIVIVSVAWNTPAFQAGLSAGDEVAAWDGIRMSHESFVQRIRESEPGSRHSLHIFRQEMLKEVKIIVGERPEEWRITAKKKPKRTDAAVSSGHGWHHARPNESELELQKGWIGAAAIKRVKEERKK